VGVHSKTGELPHQNFRLGELERNFVAHQPFHPSTMKKKFSPSFRLPQSLLLGIAILSSFSAMGQLTSFSSQYIASGSDDTRIYGVTKTLNNKLLTVGAQQTSTGLAGATYPGYLSRYQDMRLLQTDLDGNVLFNRIVGTPYDDRAFESVRGRLGEMIVVGHSGQGYTRADRQALGIAPNVNNAAVAILRLSATGALLS
jgi:hypothetical protein